MIFSTDAALGEKLKTLVTLGLGTDTSSAAIDELSRISTDSGLDLLVRGYASWALDQIRPRPASQRAKTYNVSVNSPSASDDGPGSEQQPWKTIRKAAETMRAGDTAIIHGGTYRECVRPFCGGMSRDAAITYRAAPGEIPVIKATDPWSPVWKDEGNGLWSAPYTPHAWDPPKQPQGDNPKARCEQVFVDGVLLKHLETKEECARGEDTMWIDNETTRIWVHLPAARSPADLSVERSVRQQCFVPAVRGLGHIRVQGLTMIGGAAHIWTGSNWHDIDQMSVLAVAGGHHWVIEDNTIEWGGAQGLSLGVGGFATSMKEIPLVNHPLGDQDIWKAIPGRCGAHTARRNRVNHHGISGIVAIGDAVELTIEENDVIDNNVKDCRGTCEEAGIKIHAMKDGIIRRNIVKDNLSYGIWLDANCERNRITQNILIDNANHHIFHEISPGPLLVDTNVIVGTAAEPVSTGFYTHDGNESVMINNIILGCTLGVRVRALFHRMIFDKHTTTSHNHFYNNIIDRCRDGALSLMPDVPRCEDNLSDANVLWSGGGPVVMRMENTSDVGLLWETTELGTALQFTGGGNRVIPLEAWSRYLSLDSRSLACPSRCVLGTDDPVAMRDLLVRIARDRGMDLENGYFAAKAFDPSVFPASNPALGPGCRLVRSVWTEPCAGTQVWQTGAGPVKISWNGDAVDDPVSLEHSALLDDPAIAPVEAIQLALGERTEIGLDPSWQVVAGGVPFERGSDALSVTAPLDRAPGSYAIVIAMPERWAVIPVIISQACTLDDFFAERTGGNAIIGRVTNGTGSVLDGRIEVALGGEKTGIPYSLDARKTGYFRVPVSCEDAGEAVVTAVLGGSTLQRKRLLSFAAAKRLDSWETARRYDMDSFPGGLYPEGAWAMVFYMGRLHAGWRARYSDAGLHVRVEVEHTIHIATRKDMEGIHTGDGVKIACKGKPGDRATVIGMALLSETLEQTFGFCKSANETKYPIGQFPGMDASITREGKVTAYEALISWDMINLQGPPKPGTSIPFSSMVSCKDPDMSYGLQWFYGILYDAREGDEAWMGRLWFE